MNYPFISLLLAGGFLLACSPDATRTDTHTTTDTTTNPVAADETEISCYMRKTTKDTVTLVMQKKGETVTGKLVYKLYEKDANTGTIQGHLRQDTLQAAYTFLSEGIESVREVIFLKHGDELWEATGTMEDKAGKMIFSTHANLQFPETLRLQKTTCEE